MATPSGMRRVGLGMIILAGLSGVAETARGEGGRWWSDILGYPYQGGVENYLSGWGPHCQPIPYRTNSGLYGYQDYTYGRGPVIDLGSQALQPGFRGYGVLGRHGYGLGMRPTSAIDQPVPKCRVCGREAAWGHSHR